MYYPFNYLVNTDSARPLIFFGALTILCMLSLSIVNDGLQIVALELAGSMESANFIMDSWSESEKSRAIFGTGFDYLFLLMYSLFLGLAAVKLATKSNSKFLKMSGYALGNLMLLAAILDAIENYALFQIMLDQGTELYAEMARYCAIPKFLIVITTMLYISLMALLLSFKRYTHTSLSH